MRLSRRAILIAGILTLNTGALGAETVSAAPVIIHSTWRAQPGEAIGLYGDGFEGSKADARKTTFVAIEPLSGQTGAPTPEKAKYRAATAAIEPNLIQAVLPANLPSDVYAAWIKTSDGWSKPVYINRAAPWWISEKSAYPGQTIRLFGRNFLPPTQQIQTLTAPAPRGVQVTLVDTSDGAKLDAPVLHATNWALDIQVPVGKIGATYSIHVTNGAGGEQGWSDAPATETVKLVDGKPDPLGLNVAWASEIPWASQIDARQSGAKGDGVADDTAAIQAALDKAGQAGGGVVTLDGGKYLISSLHIPSRTVLLGKGTDDVRLIWDGRPGTNPIRAAGPGIYTWAHRVVYSDGSYVGVARLTFISTTIRPSDDTSRRINGLCNPFYFNDVQSDGSPTSGQFLKSVRILNSDGCGATLEAKSDMIVADCDIDVTHGPLEFSPRGSYERVVDNELRNTQRPGIVYADDHTVIEGNTLVGASIQLPTFPADNAGTSEHRIMDLGPELLYLAQNRITGTWGKITANEGEGICWQPCDRIAYSRVGSITESTLTDATQTWKPDDLKDAKVMIVAGRGIGQLRRITSNNANTVTLDSPWQIAPDSQSVYTIDRDVTMHNLIVDNQVVAHTNKGGIVLYCKNYDNVVFGNTLRNTGGIWLTATQGAKAKRADFSYFEYVADNDLAGASRPMSEGNGKGDHLVIGSAADGGVNAAPDPALPSTGIYGNEIRDNSLTGIGAVLDTPNKYNAGYVQNSGIFVSSTSPITFPMAQGLIIEGNRVTNTIAGVHIANTSFDTLLMGNDFDGNGIAIDDKGSQRTAQIGPGGQKEPVIATAAR